MTGIQRPERAIDCLLCRGAGKLQDGPYDVGVMCDVCRGYGWLPSRFGPRLLHFLNDEHLKPGWVDSPAAFAERIRRFAKDEWARPE